MPFSAASRGSVIQATLNTKNATSVPKKQNCFALSLYENMRDITVVQRDMLKEGFRYSDTDKVTDLELENTFVCVISFLVVIIL